MRDTKQSSVLDDGLAARREWLYVVGVKVSPTTALLRTEEPLAVLSFENGLKKAR
jgi:hypothetical protein